MKKWIAVAACLLLLWGAALAEWYELLMDTGHDVFEEDGIVLAELNAVFPQIVGMADTAVMDRVNRAIQDTIRLSGGYDGVCEAAEGDYASGERDFTQMHYDLTVHAEATRATAVLLGVRYDFSAFIGGAHPSGWMVATMFDLRTGDPVTLAQMVSDGDAFQSALFQAAVADWILEEIGRSGVAGEMDYFEGYQDAVYAWYSDQAVLTDEGLLVVFNAAELGPHAVGPQAFTVPYEVLSPYWNELGNVLVG